MVWRRLWRRGKRRAEIHPDEILIDSQNVGEFDRDQFEGRMERPISRRALAVAGTFVGLMVCVLLVRAGNLQVVKGAEYAAQARENQLAEQIIFADRGVVEDRTAKPLAWNNRVAVEDDFAERVYAAYRGLAHVVGYVKPPAKDAAGFYYRDAYEGQDGIERVFNAELAGQSGLRLTETNARGAVVSEAAVRPPVPGERLVLSVDAEVTQALYDAIAARAEGSGFVGGAGVVMDVHTGELLALTSYPEYSQEALKSGDAGKIAAFNNDKRLPFLNRATDGLYAPGSIVKPIVAAAALEEGVINEHKQILSTGALVVPNPYNPDLPTVFKDWKAHGWVDMREAIAVSSDVYFYEVGGGFKDQPGLGIQKIDDYYRMFGFSVEAGLRGFSEKTGTIPTPEWKAEVFPDDPVWRVGNTYHTAIGQYGVQVTPLQAARAAAALASGKLLVPTLIASSTPTAAHIDISEYALGVAQEGMRQSVTTGIATAVNFPDLHVAAKTGTAQVGARNQYINSWIIGFWPYEKPRYAFAVVLERGPEHTTVGSAAATRDFLAWLIANAPQYAQ